MSEEPMPKNYQLLKGIVITLGILIIAMVITLVVASVMKYNDQKRAETKLVEKYRTTQPLNPTLVKPFDIHLTLEPGQKIIAVESNNEVILVSLGNLGIIEKILLISHSGTIMGTIDAR